MRSEGFQGNRVYSCNLISHKIMVIIILMLQNYSVWAHI